MSIFNTSANNALFERLGGKAGTSAIADQFYNNMLDDYRVCRFFNGVRENEQRDALKQLAAALLSGTVTTDEEETELLNNFFMAAFAKDSKPFSGGSEWGFFSYIIAQDNPSKCYVCDAHSHLLKMLPDDQHYDAVLENLASALRQCQIGESVQREVLDWAERGRNSVLGK